MKRVYSISEIESIISSNEYIDLFFYKGFCDHSNAIYRALLSHKYIDIYVLSYKIFDIMTIQLDIETVPCIIRLTKNGISYKYSGKLEINTYILENEKKYEHLIVKEIYEDKSTQIPELSNNEDSTT